MASPEYVENLKSSATRLGIVALCMEDFAAQIIQHVLKGGELNDAALLSLKKNCLHNLKQRLPINHEANEFSPAALHLETLMSSAIARGKE